MIQIASELYKRNTISTVYIYDVCLAHVSPFFVAVREPLVATSSYSFPSNLRQSLKSEIPRERLLCV